MTRFKLLLLLPVMAVALMGQACPDQDVQVRNILSTTCPALDVAFQHYDQIKASVSVRVQGNVQKFRDTSNKFCANPGSATTLTVLATASAAYLSIREAMAEARENGAEVAKVDRLERSVESIRSFVLNNR